MVNVQWCAGIYATNFSISNSTENVYQLIHKLHTSYVFRHLRLFLFTLTWYWLYVYIRICYVYNLFYKISLDFLFFPFSIYFIFTYSYRWFTAEKQNLPEFLRDCVCVCVLVGETLLGLPALTRTAFTLFYLHSFSSHTQTHIIHVLEI